LRLWWTSRRYYPRHRLALGNVSNGNPRPSVHGRLCASSANDALPRTTGSGASTITCFGPNDTYLLISETTVILRRISFKPSEWRSLTLGFSGRCLVYFVLAAATLSSSRVNERASYGNLTWKFGPTPNASRPHLTRLHPISYLWGPTARHLFRICATCFPQVAVIIRSTSRILELHGLAAHFQSWRGRAGS